MKAALLFLLLAFATLSAQSGIQANIEKLLIQNKSKEVVDITNAAISDKKTPDARKSSYLVYKADAMVRLTLYREALELTDEALHRQLDAGLLVKTYLLRELIYEILSDFKNSSIQLGKAAAILSRHPELKPKYLTEFLIRYASLLRMKDRTSRYEPVINRAILYGEKTRDSIHLQDAYMVKAFALMDRNRLDSASFFLKKNLNIVKRFKDDNNIASTYLNFSDLSQLEHKPETGLKYADSALAKLRNADFNDTKAWACQVKSELLEGLGKKDSALFYFKLFKEFSDKEKFIQKQIRVKEFDNRLLIQKERIGKKAAERTNIRLRIYLGVSFLALLVLAFMLGIFVKNRKTIRRQHATISSDAQKLQKLLDDKTFLVQELNHRVKNNLATILSLVQFHGDGLPEIGKQKFEDLHGRISTIALAHRLYAYNIDSSQGSEVNLKEFFRNILAGAKATSTRAVEEDFRCADISLPIDRALPLGMALNELLTNSLKHAAPAPAQPLRVSLIAEERENALCICYSDNGIPQEKVLREETLGLFIIEGMIRQARATFARRGFTYNITLPYAV